MKFIVPEQYHRYINIPMLAGGNSTVTEHLSNHPKVEGSVQSRLSALGEKMTKNTYATSMRRSKKALSCPNLKKSWKDIFNVPINVTCW
jgi:hypothetical protein